MSHVAEYRDPQKLLESAQTDALAYFRRRFRARDDGPFDAERDRLDELEDLAALHLQAKLGAGGGL